MQETNEHGTSPELTGGQGFTFEDAAAGVYVASLLGESTAPGLPGREVMHVSVQQGSLGQPLDDLVVQSRGVDQLTVTFSAQVKRKLVISAAKGNDDFRETIERAYQTVAAPGFKVGKDRVGVIVGEIADSSKRTFETLCEWARDESSPEHFASKLRTAGFAGDKLLHFEAVRTILSGVAPKGELDSVVYKLLRHFILLRLELLTEGSPTEAATVAALANTLTPEDRPRADDLWRRLLALVRASQGHAAGFDRKTLVARLNGAFRLSQAPSLAATLKAIEQESRLAAAEISNSISGLSVPRDGRVQAVLDAVKAPGLVQISGMPGAGKSVVLRSAVERLLEAGPVLFLKSDRLQGKTWPQYAAASGAPRAGLEELLVEIGAAGAKVLCVDGIDRIEPMHRGVILDLLRTIETSELLSGWSVLATIRDTGMEPVRTWLPPKLLAGGIRNLTVDSFDDEEAESLAKAAPALRPLLFGPEAVRTVVRRPFFAAVLAKEAHSGNAAASSEVDLAELWWRRGGYAADPTRVQQRRNALIHLARAGAHQLGRRIPVASVDAQALTELEADGIVRAVRVGHLVQFTHDIFFEWSFLQYLVSEGDNWPQVIQQIGEPPALGRVVELLSQVELVNEENWGRYLSMLEANQALRSQWLRAWMAGPFSLETFREHFATFDQAMLHGATQRVHKLVVWYQAEKTQPNTKVLERSDLPDFDIAQRMLYADILGYPFDVAAWSRFCEWLIDHAAELPTAVIPDVVSAFGVWQNLFAQFPNRISERLLQTCLAWLYHIEHTRHRREFSTDYGPWRSLDGNGHHRDELETLESSLRTLVLNSALSQRSQVTQYVRDLRHVGRLPRDAMEAVFLHSPFLSRVCPAELVDFALNVVRKRLPIDVRKDMRGRDYPISHSFGHWDWDRLSVEDHALFFPAAPTRDPFDSLLENAPDEGRRLVRELSNHATRAWRQLHRVSYEREGTPIPLVMQFPWGRQVFWGGGSQYMGARGDWGPSAVNCGLMALESWAFRQLEQNAPVDDVVQKILEGHRSVGALAVAAAICLESKHCSAATLPIATNQRLWHWDVQRHVQDMSQTANLIGFKPHEKVHAQAVKSGNDRNVRRTDIRALATLMLLRGGEVADQASAAIQRFSKDLPFDYAQQRENSNIKNELLRTAEIWGEVGKRENYRAQVSEDKSKVLISIENPKATGPDIEAMQARQKEMGRHLFLLNWAYSYFKEGALKDSPTIEEAVNAAKALDVEDLFQTGYPTVELSHQRQAAVSGVAAIVISQNVDAHIEWALEVCVRAHATPEAPDELFTRGAALMYHPVLFSARGLGAAFKQASVKGVTSLQSLLTELVAHPYEEIAVEALKGLCGAWEKHPKVAWEAMRVVSELSLHEVSYGLMPDQAQTKRLQYVHGVITGSLERIADQALTEGALPAFPPPWLAVQDGDEQLRRRQRGRRPGTAEVWEVNPLHVDTAFLQKVIAVIPVDAAVQDVRRASQFLDWCEGLAAWTIERVSPGWATSRRDLEDSNAAHFYEWQRYLYRFLAAVSLRLPAQEGTRRFLAPAMAKDDETFGSFGEWFVSYLTAQIADSPHIPPVALELLSTISSRLLTYRDWDSDDRSERELVDMVKDVFFSDLPYAGGAVRFANRQWAEVGTVIPLFEPLLKAHGSATFVARSWMSLCESSFEHYPVEHFVNHLEYLFGADGRPTGWRNTQLPARLSGLIQRFSERAQAMPLSMAQQLLRALDRLVDMGDRRAAAVQLSEVFRSVRVAPA